MLEGATNQNAEIPSELEAPMTDLLNQAFSAASQLSPAEQDALATLLLAEMASEKRWDEAFQASPSLLEQLAQEAIEEHRAGRTQPLDPGSL